MAIYTAVIDGDTGRNDDGVSGCDQFTMDVPTTTNVKIREIRLGQYSEFANAQAEIVGVQILKYIGASGDTGSIGSAGATDTGSVTPSPILGTGDTGGGVCRIMASQDTIKLDTGIPEFTKKVMYSDVFNVASGWWYYPSEEEMIILEAGDRMIVRTTKFADPTTISGTLVYEEIGKRGN